MNIAAFSRYSSLLLFVIASLLGGILYWQSQQQQESEQQQQQFQQLRDDLNLKIQRTIQDYLKTGNTTTLNEAAKQLHALDEQFTQFPATETQALRQQLEQLQRKIQTDYLAAGKLGGNTAQLLMNAESELNDALHQLQRHLMKSQLPERVSYQTITADMQNSMLKLAQLREQLLHHASESLERSLRFELEFLAQQNQALHQLPRLTDLVEAAPSDELTLTASEPTYLLDDPLATLDSVLKRYPKELDNTHHLIDQQTQVQQRLQQDVSSLESAVEGLGTSLNVIRQHDRQRALITQYAMAGALLLYAFLSWLFQQHVVVRQLQQFRQAFHELATEGSMRPLPVRHAHSELGQIATSFNELLAIRAAEQTEKSHQLEQVTSRLHQMTQEVQAMEQQARVAEDGINQGYDTLQQLHAFSTQAQQAALEMTSMSL